MKRTINLLAILICFAVTAFAFAETQRAIRRTITVPAGKRLWIDHSQGNVVVRVQNGDNSVINAMLRCSADTMATASLVCDRIDIKVEEISDGVKVQTVYPTEARGERVGFRVDYDVAIPETTLLEVENRFGEVAVSDTRANVTIRNTNGIVRLTGTKGRNEIENSFGDVEVHQNDGNVTIRNTNGAVSVRDVQGIANVINRFGRTRVNNVAGVIVDSTAGEVDIDNVAERAAQIMNSFGPVHVANVKSNVFVKNQRGDIQVSNVGAWTEVESSYGSVKLSEIGKYVLVNGTNSKISAAGLGEHATVTTTFGSVDLNEVKGAVTVNAGNSPVWVQRPGGAVSIRTTFQGVVVKDAANAVKVENQNGSITLEPSPGKCWPVSLTSNFAPIRIAVPPGTGYALNAQTTFGRIDSQGVEIQGADQHTNNLIAGARNFALHGQIPGGDCPMRLINQNGNIEIMRAR